MKHNRFLVMTVYSLAAILMAACAPDEPTPAPTASVEPSETIAPATVTSTPESTATPIHPTRTAHPSTTPRPSRTPSPSLTPTDTPQPTPDPGPFRAVVPVDDVIPVTSGGIYGLHTTPDGTLWLYTDQAVARLQDDETWEIFLPEYEGEFAGIDALGRVWVADNGLTGIAVWDGQDWTRYGEESGWVPPGFDWGGSPLLQSQVHFDAHGRLWLATVGDIRVFDGHRWFIFSPEAMGIPRSESDWNYPLAAFGIQVYEDVTWIRECGCGGPGPGPGHGVRWFDGEWHSPDLPLDTDCVTNISVDPAGQIWLGQYDRLWQIDPHGEEWTAIAMPEEAVGDLNFGYPYSLAFGPDGDVWASYNMCGPAGCWFQLNFYHIEDGIWTLIAELGPNYLAQLMLGADGTPWLFSIEGIDRVINDQREPESDLVALSVTQDKAGRVWFIAEQDGQNWLWTLDESG